jgi:hypothetical protein
LEQIIYLEPTDDILSVRDRVDMAEAKRVLLVVPPDSDVLSRRVYLQLLQRRAAQSGIELALVAGDGLVRSLAHEVGLPVFGSVEAGKRRKRWRSPRDEEEPLTQRRSEEAWEAAAQRGPRQVFAYRLRYVRLALAWLIFIAVLAVFVASAVLVVPSARITLVPASQSVVVRLNAVIDPNIRVVDYARSRIPAAADYAEIEGSAQIATSGQKDIPTSRATGKVVFVNQLSQPVKIPRGTAVRTSAFTTAVRFVTMADVEVPESFGAQAEVPVEAVDVGAGGNVAANLINEVEGVAALAVRVSNPQPTTGGGVRQVPAVVQADKDRLRAALLQQLQQRALAQLQSQLGEQEYIPPESVAVAEVLDETFDRFVGEEAPSLGLQMRVRIVALKVGMQDANALVYAAMAAKTPPGHELIANGLTFLREETLVPADQRGNLTFAMRGSGYAAARLDTDAVRRAVTGKPVESVRKYLAQVLPLQANPLVEVWPDWFGRMPFLTFRIEIQVKPQG